MKKKIKDLEFRNERTHGDLNGMMKKLQDSLPREQYESVVYETINLVSEEYMTETVVEKYASTVIESEYQGYKSSIVQTEALAEKDIKISQIYQQLSDYQYQNSLKERRMSQLERENELLREDVRILKSGMPES